MASRTGRADSQRAIALKPSPLPIVAFSGASRRLLFDRLACARHPRSRLRRLRPRARRELPRVRRYRDTIASRAQGDFVVNSLISSGDHSAAGLLSQNSFVANAQAGAAAIVKGTPSVIRITSRRVRNSSGTTELVVAGLSKVSSPKPRAAAPALLPLVKGREAPGW